MAAVKKVGQKNGEVGLLVEYLFCAQSELKSELRSISDRSNLNRS